MELATLVSLLVGFILGMVLTAVGYHKWFWEYKDTVSDLKNRLRDKNMVIKSLQNVVNNGQKK
jgi:hypothetical protein